MVTRILRVAALTFALMVTLSVTGCYGGVRPTPAALRVTVDPPTARVLLDETFIGPARRLSARPKELAPGRYRLTVEAPGYFPHDIDLELPSGETHVQISLRAIPP